MIIYGDQLDQSQSQYDQFETYYQIINANCNLALRPQLRQKIRTSDDIRIMGEIIDITNIKQIWIVKRTQNSKNQIYNFSNDLCLQSGPQGVKFAIKKEKIEQRFDFEQINSKQIRIKDYQDFYLSLDGILELNKLDKDDDTQIFQFQRIQRPFDQIKITQIVECGKQLCLGLVGVDNQQIYVSLQKRKLHINQLWKLDPIFNEKDAEQTKYSIINMLTQNRLFQNSEGELDQGNQKGKIWQLRKRHRTSGELFCTSQNKYLNIDSSTGSLFFSGPSNGTKWKFVI